MEAKDIKRCPQHGYPLPCLKCDTLLTMLMQEEIFEKGRLEGIRQMVEWSMLLPIYEA